MPDNRLLIAAVLLLAPLLAVDVPPLLDYPNHLARCVLLAFAGRDAVLGAMAEIHWAIIPNLAIDLIVTPLLWVMPVHLAGRLFLAATLLLPVLGCIAYSRAINGATSWWPSMSALVAGAGTFLLGFVNFNFSLGLALLLAAGWIRTRNIFAVTVFTGVLFFAHLMGVVFFLILVGAHELDRLLRTRRLSLASLPLLLMPAVLYINAPLSTTGGGVNFLSPADKLALLPLPFLTYNWAFDIATAAIVIGFVVLRTRMAREAKIAMALLAIFYLATPHSFKATEGLDTRFLTMFALMLFAAPVPGIGMARLPFTLLLGARALVMMAVWSGFAEDLAGLRAAIVAVPAGAKIYAAAAPLEHPSTARRLSDGTRLDLHLPALLLIEHHAFWPTLFDEPAQQPIRWRPTYRALADQTGGIMDLPLPLHATCGYDGILIIGGAAPFARLQARRQPC